jgi:kinesin family protein 5
VQKQLVEQNAQLKKEFAHAERKLIARNERIQSLEQLLQDAQNKLMMQNQKFEQQLQAVRERLEQARAAKHQAPIFSFGRIAKPLRGGGLPMTTDGSVPPNHPAAAQVAKEEKAPKRTSWLWG